MNSSAILLRPAFYASSLPRTITVKDSTDYSLYGINDQSVRGLLRVSGPSGIFYQNAGFSAADFSIPDINGSVSLEKTGITGVPLGADNEILNGVYNITYKQGNQYTLTGVSVAQKQLIIQGNHLAEINGFLSAGVWTFKVQNNASNNGVYTLDSENPPALDGGNTVLTVLQTPVANTGGGFLYVYTEVNLPVNVCFETPVGCVEIKTVCAASRLTSTDTTQYKGNFQILSREHRVMYPQTLEDKPADIVNTDISQNTSLTISPIATKTWSSVITSEVEFSFNTHDIVAVVIGSKDKDVQCDAALCKLSSCLKKFFTKYYELLGVNPAEAERMQKQIDVIVSSWMGYSVALDCDDDCEADMYLKIIREVLGRGGCDCGCGDHDAGVSSWVMPLYGSVYAGGAALLTEFIAGTINNKWLSPLVGGGLLIYTYDSDTAYPQGRYVRYGNTLFITNEAVEAGETPEADPDKYTVVGRRFFNAENYVTGTTPLAVSEHNGIVEFEDMVDVLTPVYVRINNPLFVAGGAVVCNMIDCDIDTDGGGTQIMGQKVSNGFMRLKIMNFSTGSTPVPVGKISWEIL